MQTLTITNDQHAIITTPAGVEAIRTALTDRIENLTDLIDQRYDLPLTDEIVCELAVDLADAQAALDSLNQG